MTQHVHFDLTRAEKELRAEIIASFDQQIAAAQSDDMRQFLTDQKELTLAAYVPVALKMIQIQNDGRSYDDFAGLAGIVFSNVFRLMVANAPNPRRAVTLFHGQAVCPGDNNLSFEIAPEQAGRA
ncbi:hypothetical protein [Paracoccus sp. (in: a-proteobacteria)]|uniref:hypothetical protein n=1 Tax=Paracoccus sp. TaxID=267 RepID=UPI0026E0B559|nr:hypothetical protein [Paracoccus sp. (in: a-proteobacteria)]MDO5648718.1 hypothetical protein [Paracoccus sp. (in: a-proteobacteria)]